MLVIDDLQNPRVTELLANGAVAVLPTDTVYGLACSAMQPDAVARLYKTKHRENKPGTVIAANIDQLVELGLKRRYLKAVEDYWPNPLSVVIPAGEELAHIHLGVHGLAVRLPSDSRIHELLITTGPLLTTSANMPGEPTSVTVQEAVACFGETVDFYVDGGDLSGNPPSTVIRIVDDAIEVLRQGAVEIKTGE